MLSAPCMANGLNFLIEHVSWLNSLSLSVATSYYLAIFILLAISFLFYYFILYNDSNSKKISLYFLSILKEKIFKEVRFVLFSWLGLLEKRDPGEFLRA